jgi:hypothetical protein
MRIETRIETRAQPGRDERTSRRVHLPWSGGGSGGIRTPGTSRYARFQDAWEPCVGVCAKLPTCELSSKACAEAWSMWQSVAT